MQRYLVTRVSEEMELVGVVIQRGNVEVRTPWSRYRRFLHPAGLLQHLLGHWVIRTEFAQCADVYERVERKAKQVPVDCPVLSISNINDPKTVELLTRVQPDVVLLNGTQLIRSPLLNQAPGLRLGMINLHTGLSPYSRGGNCNLHMVREGKPEYVGVTVHHVDPGIDSGDLILTGRPELSPNDSFERIEASVYLLGIDLMIRAVRLLHEGRAQRVRQWTEGKLFLVRTGYGYQPWFRFEARRALKKGLVRDYLANQKQRDAGIRLVEQGISQ
jgi:methionyl-tRNA formyltransferase